MTTENKTMETTATEIIIGLKKEVEAAKRGIICMTIVFSIVAVGFVYLMFQQIQSNARNNQRWLEYLSQYDFVSQDGEGINNTGEQGSLNNNPEERQDITE